MVHTLHIGYVCDICLAPDGNGIIILDQKNCRIQVLDKGLSPYYYQLAGISTSPRLNAICFFGQNIYLTGNQKIYIFDKGYDFVRSALVGDYFNKICCLKNGNSKYYL